MCVHYLQYKILKDEYIDVHIGGAMLHITNPYYQFEMGAKWDGEKAESFNRHNVLLNSLQSHTSKKLPRHNVVDITDYQHACIIF